MFIRNVLSFIGLFVLSTISFSATFYVDPENGSPDGDGSYEKPWRTIQEVYEAKLIQGYRWWPLPYSEESTLQRINEDAPVKEGDTILLRSGLHGELNVLGHTNKSRIVIKADFEERPLLAMIRFRGSSGWVIDGVNIQSDSHYEYPFFSVYDHSWFGPSNNIALINSNIIGQENNCEDICSNKRDGVIISSDGIVISGNSVENIRTGISSYKNKVEIRNNNIDRFNRDGIRILGDETVVDKNIVTNSIAVDGNHDDMLQSWSIGENKKVGGGVVRNNEITNNIFITNTDKESDKLDQAQGIGSFDGVYDGWLIENNVIIASHWHGITFYGIKNSMIRNNIVLDLWDDSRGPAQIRIWPHKGGVRSSNNKVYGNFAHKVIEFDGERNLFIPNNYLYKPPLDYDEIYDYVFEFVEDERFFDNYGKFYFGLRSLLSESVE